MEVTLLQAEDCGLTITLAHLVTDCIAIGVFQGGELCPLGHALDAAHSISQSINAGDIRGKLGDSLLLRAPVGPPARRILLVGLGKMERFSAQAFCKAARNALAAINALGCPDAALALPNCMDDGCDSAWAVRQQAQLARESHYRCDTMKTEKAPSPMLRRLVLAVSSDSARCSSLAEGTATGDGIALARALGDLPPNVCTPRYLAERAHALADEFGFEIDVFDADALRAMKMRSYLAVAAGSAQAPAMVVLHHQGGSSSEAPVVLVGKGLTFDSGGISIKPAAAMDEMKYDMCGAAAVLGVFRAIGALRLPLNVIGIVAACENMPSANSLRPGDILTTMNGLTVEVLNTDAEGRLVLCDALTYAERFKPGAVIDIATLTGACVVALGSHLSGLFTRSDNTHEALASELLKAGESTCDRAWRMPMEEEYHEQLVSRFADLSNIGTPGAGATVAAVFLERFTRKDTWAHLDIAGTAWKGGTDKGATGRPVALLTRFLCHRSTTAAQTRL